MFSIKFDCCFIPFKENITYVFGWVFELKGTKSFASNNVILKFAFSHIPSLLTT